MNSPLRVMVWALWMGLSRTGNVVGEGGSANGLVPVFDGNLGGDEGGAAGVAVFHGLEEVSSFLVREAGRCSVIDDEASA